MQLKNIKLQSGVDVTAITSTHVINSFTNFLCGAVALVAGTAVSVTVNIAGQALRGGQSQHTWNTNFETPGAISNYFSNHTTNLIRFAALGTGIATTVAIAKQLPIKSVPGIVALKIIGIVFLTDFLLVCMSRGNAGGLSLLAQGAFIGYCGPYSAVIPFPIPIPISHLYGAFV